jgi:uncharacterized protein (TIGR01319 family)
MARLTLLIDIGSTFTKAVAVDLDREEVLLRAESPSTVREDVNIGLANALQKIGTKIGSARGIEMIACSSAAGGLRVVSVGLVPELSCEAAKRAALGAGAKIVGHFSHKLTSKEMGHIGALAPDLVLLAGGTDGGNEDTILHNARMLACSQIASPIVVAGNKSAADRIGLVFMDSGKFVRFADNVMPEIGRLEVESCREAIREVFMQNILEAKGIDRAKSFVKDVIMPTPVAVLKAAVLLAEGTEDEAGWGEVIVADVGGATTDIYSISRGPSSKRGAYLKGLPEPYAKRTVEGDLGVRHNIDHLYEILRSRGVLVDEEVIASFRNDPSRVGRDQRELEVDAELARTAVEVGFERHAGKLETVYGPMGEILIQVGKDLSEVTKVIGTGGPIVFSIRPGDILKYVLGNSSDRYSLKPKNAGLYIDKTYIMYAMGLLAQSEPKKALRMMKKYIKPLQ